MICRFLKLFLWLPQSMYKEMKILETLKKTSNKKRLK